LPISRLGSKNHSRDKMLRARLSMITARKMRKEVPMRRKFRSFASVLSLIVAFLSIAMMALAADLDDQLVNAVVNQDKAAIRVLVKRGANVNATRADGATALLWAAHWNDLETVDLFLRAGANVNAADDHGVTPLA